VAVPESVPFEYVGGHLIAVPVTIDDSVRTRVLFDTGIGVSLLTPRLGERLRIRPQERAFTARRMSGQEVSVPLYSLSSLSLGAREESNVTVGVLDLLPSDGSLPPEFTGIEGILSPGAFPGTPVTVDPEARELVLEDEASMVDRLRRGVSVPVRVDRDGPSVGVFLDLVLPDRSGATVEVDTGTPGIILHTRFMAGLGVRAGAESVRTVRGADETGHRYTRHFAKVPGPFRVRAAPELRQDGLEVMFQEIIYDGLVGDAFLRSFRTTYDLSGSRMILSARGTEGRPPRAPRKARSSKRIVGGRAVPSPPRPQ